MSNGFSYTLKRVIFDEDYTPSDSAWYARLGVVQIGRCS